MNRFTKWYLPAGALAVSALVGGVVVLQRGSGTHKTAPTEPSVLAASADGSASHVHARTADSESGRNETPLVLTGPEALKRWQSVASMRGIPLIGDIKELGAGRALDVHETPHAIYVGANSRVLDSLGRLAASSSDERERAVDELAASASNENLEGVLARELTKDPSPDVRCAAAAGLEFAQDPASVDALLGALRDGYPEVRENARATLGLLEEARVKPRLMAAWRAERDPATREMLEQILEQVFMVDLSLEDGSST